MRAGGSRVALALARTSAYPRTETHLSRQTLSGATLSVAGVVLVAWLLAAELKEFLNVAHTKKVCAAARAAAQQPLPLPLLPGRASCCCQAAFSAAERRTAWLAAPHRRACTQLGVDTLRGQAELPVLFNITFPSLPCAGASRRARARTAVRRTKRAALSRRMVLRSARADRLRAAAVIDLEALDLAGAHEWDSTAGVNKARMRARVRARCRAQLSFCVRVARRGSTWTATPLERMRRRRASPTCSPSLGRQMHRRATPLCSCSWLML
jgi:hypothetical protein